jgi:hypothetical protein
MKIGSNPTSITAATNLEIEGTGGVKTVFLQNGNVGIGTTSPAQLLQVGDGTASTTSLVKGDTTTYGAGLQIWNDNATAGASGYIDFLMGASSSSRAAIHGRSVSDGSADLVLQGSSTSGTRSDMLYIDGSTGNVGIGTTSPSDKLAIGRSDWGYEGAQINMHRASDNTNAYSIDVYGNGSGATDAGYFRIINAKNPSALTPLVIDNNGNVGIGTTSPNALLHINNPSTSNSATTQLTIQQSGIPNINTALRVTAQSSGDLFRTSIVNNGTEHLTITSGGNVGIGTTSPGAKLEVNGVVTASNINQAPVFSTKTLASRYTMPNGSWGYTGEYITITVPAGPNRKYRLGLRQMGLGTVGMVITLSTSSSSVTGTPAGIGNPYTYTGGTWTSLYTEGYVDLAPGTYTYYVWAYGVSGTPQLANAITDGNAYCTLIAWPM